MIAHLLTFLSTVQYVVSVKVSCSAVSIFVIMQKLLHIQLQLPTDQGMRNGQWMRTNQIGIMQKSFSTAGCVCVYSPVLLLKSSPPHLLSCFNPKLFWFKWHGNSQTLIIFSFTKKPAVIESQEENILLWLKQKKQAKKQNMYLLNNV